MIRIKKNKVEAIQNEEETWIANKVNLKTM